MEKKNKWKSASKKQTKKKSNPGQYEQAATLDESGNDSIPTFIKKHDKSGMKSKYGKKEGKVKQFKPIIIATISAIAIGAFLGFMMLKMFGNFNEDIQTGGNLTPAAADVEDNDKSDDKPADTSAYTLEPFSAFVLQGGVFSKKPNAEEWVADFKEAGLHTVVWENENQYYLFAGISSSKEEAKQNAEKMQEYGVDIFVKEWSTGETKVELTEAEHKWLASFQKLWSESIESLNNNAFPLEEWKALNKDFPGGSEKISDLSKMIEVFVGEAEALDNLKYQHHLLNLWLKYDELFNG